MDKLTFTIDLSTDEGQAVMDKFLLAGGKVDESTFVFEGLVVTVVAGTVYPSRNNERWSGSVRLQVL